MDWPYLLFLNILLGFIASYLIIQISNTFVFNKILKPHSRNCFRKLAFTQVIPIISFFKLRGKCACCQNSIPMSYLAIELTIITIYIINSLILNHNLYELMLINSITFIIIIVLIAEFDKFKINDNILLVLAGLGVIYHFTYTSDIISLLALLIINYLVAVIINLLSRLLFDKIIFTPKDIKIFSISALFLMLENLSFFYIFTALSTIILIICSKDRRLSIEYQTSPTIIISLYFCILFNKSLDLNLLTIL